MPGNELGMELKIRVKCRRGKSRKKGRIDYLIVEVNKDTGGKGVGGLGGSFHSSRVCY